MPDARSLIRVLLILGAIVAPASGQWPFDPYDGPRTWIVDANNGPGTDFTDIQPAIGAAREGDTVLVRAGVYTHVTILGRGVNVVGVPGSRPSIRRARNSSWPIVRPVFEIASLSSAQSVTLRNLSITTDDWQRGIVAHDCAGRVHLHDVVISDVSSGDVLGGSEIDSCRLVTIVDSNLAGGRPALSVTSSRIVVTGGSITGASTHLFIHGGYSNPHTGLRLVSSSAMITATHITGGSGASVFLWGKISPKPGVEFGGSSTLVIAGNAGMRISAGRDAAPTGVPVPAISANGGVTADPTVTYVPVNGAPSITGPVVFRRVVGLLARATPAGDALTGQIVSPAGDLVALLAGGPTLGLGTPLGELFLERWLVAVQGVQDASERFWFTFGVPSLPALQGALIGLQAVNLYGSNGALELSNPVFVTVFP
jgi:hypothetical protein